MEAEGSSIRARLSREKLLREESGQTCTIIERWQTSVSAVHPNRSDLVQ